MPLPRAPNFYDIFISEHIILINPRIRPPCTLCEVELGDPESRLQQVEKFLGAGEFGCVYLCRTEAGHRCVVKVSEISEDWQLQEAECHASLTPHVNIVQYERHWTVGDVEGRRLYIQMEFCKGDTLEDLRLKKESRNVELYLNVFSGCLRGLNFIHRRGFIHRDIKPVRRKWVDISVKHFADGKRDTENIGLRPCPEHMVREIGARR